LSYEFSFLFSATLNYKIIVVIIIGNAAVIGIAIDIEKIVYLTSILKTQT
jgi:hypothetical protein